MKNPLLTWNSPCWSGLGRGVQWPDWVFFVVCLLWLGNMHMQVHIAFYSVLMHVGPVE